MGPRSFLAALFLVLAAGLWLGRVDMVEAHGGGFPRLTNAEAGPYRVSVWTQPYAMIVGRTHFSIAVSAPLIDSLDLDGLVLDAKVDLTVTPRDGSRPAITLPVNRGRLLHRIYYETEVELPAAGRWDVVVNVAGPAGSGRTGFSLEVQPPAPNTDWIVWSSIGLVGLIMMWGARRQQRGGSLPRLVPVLTATVLVSTMGAVFWVRTAALPARANTQSWFWVDTSPPDLVIEVTGSQWQWTFSYPDTQLSTRQLILPVGKKIELNLTSSDVIHSFSVPEFQLKRDVMPGVTTTVQVTPAQPGTYSVICEAFCGLDAQDMLAEIQVVTPADFETWLAQQQQLKLQILPELGSE